MSLFTSEQLTELEQTFGLKRRQTFQVRDGRVAIGDKIWWRAPEGPKQQELTKALAYSVYFLSNYGEYQISEPQTELVYKD